VGVGGWKVGKGLVKGWRIDVDSRTLRCYSAIYPYTSLVLVLRLYLVLWFSGSSKLIHTVILKVSHNRRIKLQHFWVECLFLQLAYPNVCFGKS
jgi:hypothetical protein